MALSLKLFPVPGLSRVFAALTRTCKSGRIGAEEDIDDFKGMSEVEIQELLEEREAKANAQILKMVGDIPDEDIAPPENVLFVCKLNPVTTDEDLEIIFSRFGSIKSCEVIRDQKTKESLQYAFIEFAKPQECENAYFKMDNVLIDDRRIHVDFSQSVAKYKLKGKGRGVEVMKEDKDDFSSKYTIKDNTRKDDRYSLVFDDEEELSRGTKKRKKKKHKTKHDSDGDSDQGRQKKSKHKKHKHERSRSRSRSPKEDKQKRKKQSPPRGRDRDRGERSPEYRERGRRSPEYRDKGSRSSGFRDRGRDSSSPEYKEIYREKERHRDSDKQRYRDLEKYRDRRDR